MRETTDPAHNEDMSTPTSTETSADLQPIGWLRRPNGGRMFTPGKRHFYDATLDLNEVGELRTLCVTLVPKPVLQDLRSTRSYSTQGRAAVLMDQAELANAEPCSRCAKKAAR